MKIAKIYEKWEGTEEVNKTNLVIGVTCLIEYLLALGSFTNDKLPLRIHITVQRQALAYLMGDTSGVGFVYVLWDQGRIIYGCAVYCNTTNSGHL